jgi:hypothetical protein
LAFIDSSTYICNTVTCGELEYLSANTSSMTNIPIGTRRSDDGGGANGGRASGSISRDTVIQASTANDLIEKYFEKYVLLSSAPV